MKKAIATILPLALSVALTTSAYASADNDYYVFAEKGAQAATADRNDFNAFSIQFFTGLGAPFAKVDENGTATPMQIPLGGAVGISHVWNQFYLGGQAQFAWNFVPSKTGYLGNQKDVSLTSKWQTMATLQVGGVISDTNVVYADVGYALGSFSYVDSAQKERGFYQGGPAAGIGASLQLSDNINFDMNYHFIYYLEKKNIKNYGNVKFRQNLITAGISFHFA